MRKQQSLIRKTGYSDHSWLFRSKHMKYEKLARDTKEETDRSVPKSILLHFLMES